MYIEGGGGGENSARKGKARGRMGTGTRASVGRRYAMCCGFESCLRQLIISLEKEELSSGVQMM